MSTLATEDRMRRAASFDEDAELYDRGRPAYPGLLFDELIRVAALPDAPSIVEVGCGTGQASVPLARRGCRLTCIEAGANMVAVARRNLAAFPNATVLHTKFEDWDPGGQRHDLVFAAAAWHWIDPDSKYQKASAVLKPGGQLAVLSSEHAYPEDHDPLLERIQDVYQEATGSRLSWPPMPPAEDPDWAGELESGGLFGDIRVIRHLWHFDCTADAYIALLATFSDNRVRDAAQRQRLFRGIHRLISERPGGMLRKHYLSFLCIARRSGQQVECSSAATRAPALARRL